MCVSLLVSVSVCVCSCVMCYCLHVFLSFNVISNQGTNKTHIIGVRPVNLTL